MEKYLNLRNQYSEFIYNSFEIKERENEIEIIYNFEIVGLTVFTPKWIFRKPKGFTVNESNEKLIENLVFNLGMVEAVSYFKCVCPKTFKIKAGYIDESQIKWWKKLYINGLGEFFYINGILEAMNIDTFINLQVESDNKYEKIAMDNIIKGNLIPIGGGKDSLVTLDLLKDFKQDNVCYIVNARGATKESATASGYEETEIYEAKRFLDKKLLKLNEEGFLNGHTPFSAILAFSSYITAVMLNKKYIALSNESSANEGNVKGTNINHQYSKSIEFEKDFREYIEQYVCTNGPEYFSILRPLSEWQIVKSFSNLKKHFPIFKSCNVGSKEDIWCENCPKCLYVYIMMKAFLTDKEMQEIFQSEMLNEKKHRKLFNGLVYPNDNKPFECVGTKAEINLAVKKIITDYIKKDEELPLLLQDYGKVENDVALEIEQANASWGEDIFIPEKYIKILKEYIGG
ncbi:MAG: hypothetical protein PHR25_00405 [Clostridia bacterium]|nr:hypothetical protein [Clostridia bacterium]MDD4375235.1 hypothetical protein [Clostridia bacterium]